MLKNGKALEEIMSFLGDKGKDVVFICREAVLCAPDDNTDEIYNRLKNRGI